MSLQEKTNFFINFMMKRDLFTTYKGGTLSIYVRYVYFHDIDKQLVFQVERKWEGDSKYSKADIDYLITSLIIHIAITYFGLYMFGHQVKIL
jgi:hypothetical protein